MRGQGRSVLSERSSFGFGHCSEIMKSFNFATTTALCLDTALDGMSSTRTISLSANSGQWKVSEETCAAESTHTTTIRINNSDKEPPTRNGEADVNDSSVAFGAFTISAYTNVPFSGKVGFIRDANANGTVSEFSATIDWGDGITTVASLSLDSAGAFDVTGTHTYTAVGSYTTTIHFQHVRGVAGTCHGTANVTEPPPIVHAVVLKSSDEAEVSPVDTAGKHSELRRGKSTVTITIRDLGRSTASETTRMSGAPVVSHPGALFYPSAPSFQMHSWREIK